MRERNRDRETGRERRRKRETEREREGRKKDSKILFCIYIRNENNKM